MKPLSLHGYTMLLLLITASQTSCKVSETVFSHANTDQPARGRHLSHVGKTHWSYFWGLLGNEPWAAGCQQGSDISRARVTTNPGFIIISFVSLGIAVPQKMEWDCSQPFRSGGTIGQ